jgi:hypothetical protein
VEAKMMIFLAVVGVALVLGVWAVYVRLGLLFEFWAKKSEENLKSLKHELDILWVAISSEPDDRATRRKDFGLGPLYLFDEEITSYIEPRRERHQHLVEELKHLESRSWDYTDAADREAKKKKLEELRLEVLVGNASANSEQQTAWDRIQEERLEQSYPRKAKEPKK